MWPLGIDGLRDGSSGKRWGQGEDGPEWGDLALGER
jgi:hypothetical protein